MAGFDLDNLLADLGVRKRSAEAAPPDAPEESSAGDAFAALGSTGIIGLDNQAPSPPAASSAPPTDDSAELETPLASESSEEPPEPAPAAPQAKAAPAPQKPAAPLDSFDPPVDESLELLWLPQGGSPPPTSAASEALGRLLLERRIISAEQLQSARRVMSQSPGRRLKDILVEMGIGEEPLQQVIAEVFDLTFERLNPDTGCDETLLNRLSPEFCKAHHVIPIRRDGRRIVIGTSRPDDLFVLEEARRLLGGRPVRHVLVTEADIALILDMHTQGEVQDEAINDILSDIEEDDVAVVEEKSAAEDFEKQAGEGPVIRYVNLIIQTALREKASDIHIEPGEKRLKVRFRIDGVLFDMMSPPWKMHAAMISRLKIMANLDISERRLPQDGRIRALVAGRKLDLRVSTLPTVSGEKCVIRILDNKSISVGLDELGFGEESLQIWRSQINQPNGIILVTGPTGSGKTTTLYSSLREMDTQRLNVSTVEDPVEYHLDGIAQVQIHDRIGMSFSAALRSLLRQDPDVIMVGEIRDAETARIAVQAALTGHLVLSTLHTNDAPSTVTRLINIGVEPFLIGAALNSVLAQRLIRRTCQHCRTPLELTDEAREFAELQGVSASQLFEGSGCERCRQTGYAGRLGIYELLVLDDVTRDAIARNPNVTEFRRMCIERGMVTLRQDGMLKAAKGMTTIEEILRVTQSTI